jgi:hypothetical protein
MSGYSISQVGKILRCDIYCHAIEKLEITLLTFLAEDMWELYTRIPKRNESSL